MHVGLLNLLSPDVFSRVRILSKIRWWLGSVSQPAGGVYSAPSDALSALWRRSREGTNVGRGNGKEGERGWKRERERRGVAASQIQLVDPPLQASDATATCVQTIYIDVAPDGGKI